MEANKSTSTSLRREKSQNVKRPAKLSSTPAVTYRHRSMTRTRGQKQPESTGGSTTVVPRHPHNIASREDELLSFPVKLNLQHVQFARQHSGQYNAALSRL